MHKLLMKMKSQGLSYRQAAKRCGIANQSQLHGIIYGTRGVSMATAKKISDNLGIPMEDLTVDRKGKPEHERGN